MSWRATLILHADGRHTIAGLDSGSDQSFGSRSILEKQIPTSTTPDPTTLLVDLEKRWMLHTNTLSRNTVLHGIIGMRTSRFHSDYNFRRRSSHRSFPNPFHDLGLDELCSEHLDGLPLDKLPFWRELPDKQPRLRAGASNDRRWDQIDNGQ